MNNQKPKKLKKYLFLISIIFFVVTLVHILYNYLYENSEIVPIKGGIVSEGIVGKLPSLNPLKTLSGNNEYILRLLYRSMLKYDIDQQKIVGDIASCDISSLVNIECIINDGAVWSDGEKITSDDIKSTYELIKETDSNPTIASLLSGVEIVVKGDDEIIFKNEQKDVNFLNVFFQPIISRKTIDKLTMDEISGNFPYIDGIYSGEYILGGVKADNSIGIKKVILDKNETFGVSNISRIDIYVFNDEVSLENNIKTINVFNDENNALGDSIPRFESYRYNLPQFLSLFINISKIENQDLRTFILNEVNRENLINTLGEINYTPVLNPYMTEVDLKQEPENKNLESIMASIGYKKKSTLVQNLKKEALDKFEKENVSTGNTNNEDKVLDEEFKELDRTEGIDKYQIDSKIITFPEYVDKYNFITMDDFSLIGNAGKDVESVYINDYKLQGFDSGDEEFFYKISEDSENIKEGINNYKIYFVIDGKKELQEEITFLYYKDRDTLNLKTEEFVDSLYDAEEEKMKKEIEEKKQLEEEKIEKEVVETKKEIEIPQEELDKLNLLDDKLFYDENLEPYTLNLFYLNTRKDFEETADFIQTSLKEIGITVNVKAFDIKDFGEKLKEKEYDMILGGIDLGYFDFNIFPYFHSSQVESGFNFSELKKTSLDLLLEEAKENIYNEEKTNELEEKVLDSLKEEQVMKTLYSPKMNLLVDKTIKLSKDFDMIPSTSIRSKIIETSYKKQEQILSLEGKNITGFFKYMFKKLYEG